MKCVRCRGQDVEYQKTIMQNGAVAIAAICHDCQRRATDETWLPKSHFSAAQIAAMPVAADYTGAIKCQYRGCNAVAVEWNHYAPRYLFGANCEEWPVGPLCPAHHRTWHFGLEGRLMATCPNCQQRLESTAIVTAFNDPPNWTFWGQEGARWIVCRGDGYVHFRVIIDGRTYHRLAQITTEPMVKPVIASGQIAQPLPKLKEKDEWLP